MVGSCLRFGEGRGVILIGEVGGRVGSKVGSYLFGSDSCAQLNCTQLDLKVGETDCITEVGDDAGRGGA